MRVCVRMALRSHEECYVLRIMLLMSLEIVCRCAAVRYGTVMLTGRHSGMLRLDAIRWISLFSSAVWA